MGPRHGAAQKEFIRAVRDDINLKQEKYFHLQEWRNITPAGGRYAALSSKKKLHVDSYYVKPLASWVPHLLMPGHVPSCPKCDSNKHVDTASSRWVSFPKLLYGIKQHKYLDTKMYPCRSCKKEFTGYNKRTLQLDADQIVGYFNCFLATKHAIDDELYSFIVNSPDSSPARIAQHLQRMAADNFFQDYQSFLHAVRFDRIKGTATDVSRLDPRQPRIAQALERQVQQQSTDTDPTSAAGQLKRSLLKDIRDLRLKLISAEAALDLSTEGPKRNKLCFRALCEAKQSRNNRDLPLPSLGEGKLKTLLSLGVNNAVELIEFVDCDGVFCSKRTRNGKLRKWQAEAEACFDAKREKRDVLEEQLKTKEAQLKSVSTWSSIEDSLAVASDMEEEEEPPVTTAPSESASRPSLFSGMTDPTGCNARFLSTSQVNTILETEFRHRKPVQEAKMMGLSGEMHKIDWSYKIAGKTHVCTGPGLCFRPCTSIMNAQNEDGMTPCWKANSGGESLDAVGDDLARLNRRNVRLKNKLKGVCVDVCCQRRNRFKTLFGPEMWAKLDSFHWMKRWNPALLKPSSEKGQIFRAAMSRALFVVPPSEHESAKARTKARKTNEKKPTNWEPSNWQIKKEANSTIPDPENLTRRVNAIIRHFKFQDAETDMQLATWNGREADKPLRFFKNSRNTENIIKEQLKHVRLGCLSDPSGVSMHHQNPVTGKFYCRRGTSSIESDHRGLDEMTGTHIGVGLCDRKSTTYFEMLNEKKRVNRLGETDCGTHRTETLALVNSLASSAGFADDNLPFPDLSVPAMPRKEDREFFGFNMPLNGDIENLANPALMAETMCGDGTVEDTDDDAEDKDPEEEPIDLTEFLSDLTDQVEEEEADVNDDDNNNENPQQRDAVELAAEKILPTIEANETTMKAHERLTNQQAWCPFADKAETKMDQEEFAQFDLMCDDYSRKVSPRCRKGYHYFANAWNVEVADRYRRYIEGDDTVVFIRRKSAIQLQKHYDNMQGKKEWPYNQTLFATRHGEKKCTTP